MSFFGLYFHCAPCDVTWTAQRSEENKEVCWSCGGEGVQTPRLFLPSSQL